MIPQIMERLEKFYVILIKINLYDVVFNFYQLMCSMIPSKASKYSKCNVISKQQKRHQRSMKRVTEPILRLTFLKVIFIPSSKKCTKSVSVNFLT